jgi:hypothetical protein
MTQRDVDLLAHVETKIREQEREAVAAEREAREEAKRQNSPEARAAAVEADHAAAEARAALAAKSKAFLVRNGHMDEAMVKDMNDSEALWATGVEPKPYSAMSLTEKDAAAEAIIGDGSYAGMPLIERIKTARELNGSVEAFDSYAVQNGQRPDDAQLDNFTRSLDEDGEDV